MKPRASVIVLPYAVVMGVCLVNGAHAQYRSNQPQVLRAPPAPVAEPKADNATQLARSYARAKRPRIVLYWNNEVTDQTQTTRADVLHNRLDVRERPARYSETETTVLARNVALQQQRGTRLAPRDAALLTQAFTAEFGRAGVNFIDRSLIIRATAAKGYRTGGDPLLIESDALKAHADLLMEVVQVPDPNAPLGYAFDIRVKHLKRGQQTAAVYSLGQAPQEALPAQWVATDRGYELRVPPRTAPSGAAGEIGKLVAQDAMQGLSEALRSY